jgi:pyruvate dehydrogenase (quinone)
VSSARALVGCAESWPSALAPRPYFELLGPSLLHVKVKPMQLVMPPSPFVSPEAVVGMGVYSARAMLQGKGRDVWEMMVENIP